MALKHVSDAGVESEPQGILIVVQKLRIALIVEHLTSGGTEKVALDLAAGFEALGYSSQLITFDAPTDRPFFPVPEKMKVSRLSGGRLLNWLTSGKRDQVGGVLPLWRLVPSTIIRLWQLRSELRGLLITDDPLILVGLGTQMSSLGIIASAGLGVPFVATEHFAPATGGLLKKLVRAITYPHAKAIVVLTHRSRNQLSRSLQKKTHIIPNSIDRPTEIKTDYFPKSKLVLAVGRLVDQKGFDILIKLFAQRPSDFQSWKLKIIGEGPERIALESLVDKLKQRDCISIEPPTLRLHQEYLSADIFALSSRFEGFSLVLAEAMSRGLPVISFDCDLGPGEMIESNRNGLLIEPERERDFLLGLQQLMRDQDLRERLGRAAIDVQNRFAKNKVFELWGALIRSIGTLQNEKR